MVTATCTPAVGPATQLAFSQQPTDALAGAAITPSPTVRILDASGNLISGSTAPVTLAIGTNPASGTLSGTVTRNAVAGVATFPGLSLNNAGTGYTLTAASSGLTGATSSAFNVTSPAPTVTSLSPASGPAQGGTLVTVTGTNFTGATTVSFGGEPSDLVTDVTATSLLALAPAGTGLVDVVVFTPGGNSTTAGTGNDYTYVANQAITVSLSFAPEPLTIGSDGTLTITFTNPNTSAAGAVSPTVTADPTRVTRNSTPRGGTCPMAPFNPAFSDLGLNSLAVPVGGCTVTLGFTGTSAGQASFSLSAFTPQHYTQTPAASTTTMVQAAVVDPTPTLTFATPTSASVAVGGSLTNAATSSLPAGGAITYASATTGVATVNATTGVITPVSAGTSVITATQAASAGVNVQATQTYTVTVNPALTTIRRITAVSLTQNSATGLPVAPVTASGGTGTLSYALYRSEDPAIVPAGLSFSATTGQFTGTPTAVQARTFYTVRVTDQSTPPVTVVSDGFGVTINAAALPTVTSLSPNAGEDFGGRVVTITGTNFTGATAVRFGSTAATSFTINSATSITATAPTGTANTTVDVTVTTPAGTSSTAGSGDNFLIRAAQIPSVITVVEGRGPLAGGTVVTLTGANFFGASSVRFGSIPATSFTVIDDNLITATAPAGTGTVDVTVTAPGGTSATGHEFTYVAAPTVTALSSSEGPPTGNTFVTLTGTDFIDVTSVMFGSTPAASWNDINATTIVAFSPAGTGTVDVTVVAVGGTSATAGSGNDFTYLGAPTVTALSPSAGPSAGGTTVTLTGTGFGGATEVRFGSNIAAFTFISASSISAVVPTGSAGTVDVTVTTPSGISATAGPGNDYTYADAPTVTGLSPATGTSDGGTVVTLTGTNLSGATAVMFGSTPATNVTVVNGTSITATAPAGTRAQFVTVTTAGGTSAGRPENIYTYVESPTVTALSPSSGRFTGGTEVLLTGANFTGATNVMFGSTPATYFEFFTANSMRAYAPAGTGTVDVTVVTPTGTSPTTGSGNDFTYIGAPTVTALSPNSGSTSAGTVVTITGTNFYGTPTVRFDGSAASNVVVNSATSLTAEAPSRTGTVEVTVTTDSGTSDTAGTANDYVYYTVPTVTALSPARGPEAGGNTVTLTGTNFSGPTGVTSVMFGSTPATGLQILGANSLQVVAPAGTGTVDVTVITAHVTSGATGTGNDYTYFGTPTVTSLSPVSGPTTSGTVVILTGTNFTGVTGVSFGAAAATNVTFNSATSITATTPAGTGTVDVRVTTPGGTSATTGTGNDFTYVLRPTVTGVSPSSGPITGGTVVTVTGTNFASGATVMFGATPATNISVGETSIIATAPAGTGTVDVTVTTLGGTSATAGASNDFVYVGGPVVTGLSPATGPLAGGTAVTLTGTGFISGATVSFGGVEGTGVTVLTDTSITATAPAGSGTVDVTVTTTGGTSPTTGSGNDYVYAAVPTVTALSPASGSTEGGTVVTLTGTDFTGVTAVRFGTTAATGVTFLSATSIMATAPAGTRIVDVTVTTPGGTSATTGTGNDFTYVVPPPTVTALSPATGPGSGLTVVTITGTNFSGESTVMFGGAAGTNVTVASATSITATAPAGVGTVDVTVTTPTGTSPTTGTGNDFVYIAAPTVTALSPATGSILGGTVVTLTGTGFSDVLTVQFGSANAPNFTVNSSTSITVAAPQQSAGTVDVVVRTSAGQSDTTGTGDDFTYVPPSAPTITGLSPAYAPLVGGTQITITGTDFVGVGNVTICRDNVSYTVDSPTSITATTRAGTGTFDVEVRTTFGTSDTTGTADDLTYLPIPAVTGLSPAAGLAAGGQTVTLTGTDFTAVSAVRFGSQPATFTVNSPSSITATSPAGTGTVDVTVTTPGGTSSTNGNDNDFIYAAAPAVTAVSPAFGAPAGGTGVTLTGTNFIGATAVRFGSILATGVSVVNATSIVATAPAGTGTVDVTVTTPSGTSATAGSGDDFAYLSASTPTVTALSPSSGLSAGDDRITLTGTNFDGVTAVRFGATSTDDFRVLSSTEIAVSTPPGTGTVDVTVVSPNGTSPAGGTGNDYTYIPTPTITSVSPASGPTTGGTVVTITGANLADVDFVAFGNEEATFTVNSPTSITATAPAGTGTVDVRVTVPGGGTSTTAGTVNDFVYASTGPGAPTVTALSPSSGPAAGGTVVTLTGTDFTDATAVSFGSTAGTDLVVNDSTSITITAPPGTGTVDVTVTTPLGTSAITGSGNDYGYVAAADPTPTLTFATATAASVALNGSLTNAATSSLPGGGAISYASATPGVATVNSTTGAITPVGPGTTVITATQAASAGVNAQATQTYTVTVSAAVSGVATSFETVLTQNSATGLPYAPVTASGGNGVLSFALLTAGGEPATLPAGLSFSTTTGQITGTPTASLVRTGFRVVVTDQSTVPAFSGDAFRLTVTAAATPSLPTVTGLSPSTGPAAGGTVVTLTGMGFASGATVMFGPNAATDVSVGETSITATAPAGTGTVDVTVTTGAGTSLTAGTGNDFTYGAATAPPTVAAVSADVAYDSAGQPIDLIVAGPFTSLSVASEPSHGTVTISGTTATYVPASGYFGADSFTYTATNASGTSAPATVTLTVSTPAVPTVAATTATVGYNATGQAIPLKATGVFTSLSVATAPAKGTVTISGTTATYVPTRGLFGADSFTYVATGAGGASSPATVTLTIAAPPPPVVTPPAPSSVPPVVDGSGGGDAAAPSAVVNLPTTTTGEVTEYEIDIQAENGAATIEIVQLGLPTTMQLGGARLYRLRYTPRAGFMGIDRVTVVAIGPGGRSAPAVFTFNVPGQAPNLSARLLSNGAVTLSPTSGIVGGPFQGLRITRPPAFGTATVSGLNIVFTPGIANDGATSLDYVVVLPFGTSAAGRIDLQSDLVPIVAPIAITTPAGRPVTVSLTADARGGPFTAATVAGLSIPTAGAATLTAGGTAAARTYELTFTPAGQFTGRVDINFTLSNAFATSTGVVQVTVEPRPDPSLDPDVRALVSSQADAARRFARAQNANFNQRLEQIRDGDNRSSNRLALNLGAFQNTARLPNVELQQRLGVQLDEEGLSPRDRANQEEERLFFDRFAAHRALGAGTGTTGGTTGGEDARAARGSGDAGTADPAGTPSRVGVWAGGSLDWGRRDAEGLVDTRFSTSGLSAGLDMKVSDALILGGGVGYGGDHAIIGEQGTASDSRTLVGVLYGSWRVSEDLHLAGLVGQGGLEYETRRWSGPASAYALGERSGSMTFGSVTLAYDRQARRTNQSFYGRLETNRVSLDAFTETGAGIYALTFDTLDIDTLTGNLGIKLDWLFEGRDSAFAPSVRLEWRHEFDQPDNQTVTYADWLASPSYGVMLESWSRNSLAVDLGGRWTVSDQIDLTAAYRATLGSNTASQGVQIKLSTRF